MTFIDYPTRWNFIVLAIAGVVSACGGNRNGGIGDGGDGDSGFDGGTNNPDSALISPVRLLNFTPRLTRGGFQCQANAPEEFSDCADYRFSFVIENDHASAAVQRLEGMKWAIGSASASVGKPCCDTEPWVVPSQTTSLLIDVVFVYSDNQVGAINGFHFPCSGGTSKSEVSGLAPAEYSGDMTFGIDVTLSNGEFLRLQATAALVDAT